MLASDERSYDYGAASIKQQRKIERRNIEQLEVDLGNRCAQLARAIAELQNAVAAMRDHESKLALQVTELEQQRDRLLGGVRQLHDEVDQTNPDCPIGAALTRCGLAGCP